MTARPTTAHDGARRIGYEDVISPIEDIVEDARKGRMFILVDDESRENEGDLVIPAQAATPEAVSFMAVHGRGLICLAMTGERVRDLGLWLMSPVNQTRDETAFTVSIEAREGVTTGISAQDRARTIAVAIDETRGPRDIVTPGHVFPLVAKEGGVLTRAGHTEAAVDLARLAGMYPAGVICEIMNDDGSMARLPDLVGFAQLHGLKIGAIADLIAYRRRWDRLIERVAEEDVDSVHGGAMRMIVYEAKAERAQHVALVKGDLSAPGPVLARVHAVDALDDLLGLSAGRDSFVADSLAMIAREGRGVMVLIRDVDPDAVTNKLARRNVVRDSAVEGRRRDPHPPAIRYTGVGAQILLDLGVREMTLLSNTRGRAVVALEGYGLSIVGEREIEAGLAARRRGG